MKQFLQVFNMDTHVLDLLSCHTIHTSCLTNTLLTSKFFYKQHIWNCLAGSPLSSGVHGELATVLFQAGMLHSLYNLPQQSLDNPDAQNIRKLK